MRDFLKDLTHGARSLRKNPAFTTVAVLTIALGIGASTAIFSVVNAVLLRPLPYSDAERLVLVWGDMRARAVFDFPFPPADYQDLRQQANLFEDFAAVSTGRQTVSGDNGDPEQIRSAFVTANLFEMLGMRVIAGRDFVESDATPQAPPPQGVAPENAPPPLPAMTILSHGFWQRRYGGDPSIVGRNIDVGQQRAEVIGILAPEAELLFPPGTSIERIPDTWTAMRIDFAGGSRINVFLSVIGKLKPGVTVAAAEAQLETIAAQLREQFPIKKTADLHFRVEPMHDDLVADVRRLIVALMGAVLFVLLIACANVANLLLVRSAGKERELAVRAALGGNRWRLMTPALAESLLLGAGGAVLGLLLAQLGIRALIALAPDGLPRIESIGIDPLVLGFTAIAGFLAAFTFGLVPALRASRTDVADILREAGRSGALARGRFLRSAVVVAEVALTFVLLIGSGLMLRSFSALQRVDPGFTAEGLLTFVANARGNGGQRAAFMQQMQQRLGALPGVTGVTAATPFPLDGGAGNARWGTQEAAADPSKFQQATVHFVLPGYFETTKANLIAGRTYTVADNNPTTLNVVIDDVLARKAFGDQPAVGKQLLIRVRTNEPETYTVVGVVKQQRHVALTGDERETVFFTDGLMGNGLASRWAVRTTGDPLTLANSVRAAVKEIDPLVTVAEVQPMTALVERAMARTRFALVPIAVFAGIAGFLAAIGLYGVLSTMVRQRTAEIGVRVAFGAPRSRILQLVVGHGLKLSAAGIAAGVLAAFGATRILSTLLVGVAPTDPLTYGTTAVGFLAVTAIACFLPGWRAARMDPTAALRDP
ncbi:MAG: ABC transporter permease [Gemmatimonadota bacterium]